MADEPPGRRQAARSPAKTPLDGPAEEEVEALGDHLCALPLSRNPIQRALFLRLGKEPTPEGVVVVDPKLVERPALFPAPVLPTPLA